MEFEADDGDDNDDLLELTEMGDGNASNLNSNAAVDENVNPKLGMIQAISMIVGIMIGSVSCVYIAVVAATVH